MTVSTTEQDPLLVARAVAVPRQFAVVGTIHSLAIGLFLGFLALIALKLGADLVTGRSGDANLPFALAWSAVAFGVATLGLWAYHYWELVEQRSRTSYAVYPDRVEVRRDGSDRPVDVVPLGRTLAVQSWSGPLLKPHGVATLTLIAADPPDASGRSRHVFHPLANVADPEAFAELVRSLAAGPG